MTKRKHEHFGGPDGVHISHKFEHLLGAYRRSDGRRWGGQALEDATGGVVTRSYVTNLLKGRIESPGYDKLHAIAEAMDFPPALWFEEDPVGSMNAGPYGDLVAALRDDTVQAITRESARLSGRDKEIVLGMVRQFKEAEDRQTGQRR